MLRSREVVTLPSEDDTTVAPQQTDVSDGQLAAKTQNVESPKGHPFADEDRSVEKILGGDEKAKGRRDDV